MIDEPYNLECMYDLDQLIYVHDFGQLIYLHDLGHLIYTQALITDLV